MAVTVILAFASLLSTCGQWMVAQGEVASFSNFTFNAYGPFETLDSTVGPWCLGILLLLVIFLTTIAILLFRKRMRQVRLLILSTIYLVGYVICYALFAYYYHLNLLTVSTPVPPTFHFPLVATFPILSIILNVLAIQAIRRDEALVRSLDRIRP